MHGSTPEPLLASEPSKPSPDTPPPTAPPEWLDAHRRLVFLLLVGVPFLVTLPLWIFGLSADPIWFFSGLVRDVKPGLMTHGSPFGDPNEGWMSQALGHLAAWQWLHGKVPWWNPYSGIGLPLAGEMQPGAFFLPFILLLLLHSGFVWLRIAMQLVAGFSTFYLLREMRLGRLAALLGGILFEFCGTFAWTRGPDSFFCAAAFLPLLLLGIEQVCKRERERTGTLWIAIGIAFSVLAGFPEAAYIDGLLALLWAIGRFVTIGNRWRFALRVAWGGLLGLLLSAPLLAGFWALSTQSSAFAAHTWGNAALQHAAIPMVFLPYVYSPHPDVLGNLLVLNNWANLGGYAGIVLFFFALLGLQARSRPLWLRLLLIAWVALSWAKTFGVKPVMTITNHVPLLLQTAFYRYSPPSWELCLILLAVFGIEELRYRKLRLGFAGLFTAAALALSIAIAWPGRSLWGWQPTQMAVAFKYLGCSLLWVWILFEIARFAFRWQGEKRRAVLAAILGFDAIVLFAILLVAAPRPGIVDLPAMRFLKTHLGLSRFYTVDRIQPNYSAYFRTASINYDSFPVPDSFAQHVTKHLFPPLPISSDVIFWPALVLYGANPGLTYLWQFLPNYQALGVKYVVADLGTPGKLNPESSVATGNAGNEPLALLPGQQAQFSVPLPEKPPDARNRIAGVGIALGNYSNTADGNLSVRICAGANCAEDARRLSESADNSFFYISFPQPLSVSPGTSVAITAAHQGGTKPVALWLWPALPGQNQNILGPDGKTFPAKAIRVSFTYESVFGGMPRVYHDSLMDIFEVPNPAPYYSIASGGPCRLDALQRDSVNAVCDSPAVLIRRELFMPGWHASLNGKRLDAQSHGEIFQSYNLPAGDSHLRFGYVPPHASLAGLASLFAFVALLAEFLFARKNRLRLRTDVAA